MTDELPLSDTTSIKEKHLIGPLHNPQKDEGRCGKCGEKLEHQEKYYILKILYASNQPICSKCVSALKI